MAFEVYEYRGGRDADVAGLILSIQNGEAALDLTVDEQPDLIDIPASYAKGGFWVAVDDDRVVGSIGLLDLDGRGVLKKFFVAAPYRGREGPAQALFDALLRRAHELGLSDVVLDTPSVATRSHAFYLRAGFRPITQAELPEGYAYPDRNSRLFQLALQDA